MGGLVVGKSESRECTILLGEPGQSVDNDDKFVYQDIATFPEKYEVRVAVITITFSVKKVGLENKGPEDALGHIAGCCAKA